MVLDAVSNAIKRGTGVLKLLCNFLSLIMIEMALKPSEHYLPVVKKALTQLKSLDSLRCLVGPK